jgi:hypothetical protein
MCGLNLLIQCFRLAIQICFCISIDLGSLVLQILHHVQYIYRPFSALMHFLGELFILFKCFQNSHGSMKGFIALSGILYFLV